MTLPKELKDDLIIALNESITAHVLIINNSLKQHETEMQKTVQLMAKERADFSNSLITRINQL
jgi:hypothetical protein